MKIHYFASWKSRKKGEKRNMKLNEENKVNDDNAQNLCCHLSFYCSGINVFLLRKKMNFHFLSIFIPSQQCFSFLILLLFISFIFRCFFLRVFIFLSFVLCTENIVISCFIAAYASTHFQRFIPSLCCKEITNFEIFFRFSVTIDNHNWQKKKKRKYQ